MYEKWNRAAQFKSSGLRSAAIIEGGTNFLWAAHRNSYTGRNKGFWALVQSNSCNLDDIMGMSEAGHSVLASTTVVRTRGGIIKLDFPRKTGGF